MSIMTAKELVQKHIDVAENYKTIYAWGCFGFPCAQAILNEKKAQYPDWYNANRMAMYQAKIGTGTFLFDCVNLTKGLLWGWNGNKNAVYGGAKYAANGVPDVSADGMIALCKNVSTSNWSSMVPGEGLWGPGHWGLYIGDGLAVECTPAWKNGVQITAVGNIGAKSGYNTRNWTKHGRLPWIDYGDSSTGSTAKNSEIIVCGKRYPIDRQLVGGQNYFKIRDLVEILQQAGVCDLKVGNKGSIAVLDKK